MTRLPGAPDRDDALPGMAHFAGTGPADKTCGHCLHRGLSRQGTKPKYSEEIKAFVYKTYRTAQCVMFMRLNGGVYGAAVKSGYQSCKYFEDKKK
jgi:hypothetical protein